ncbi:MAG: hypothetical protein HY921_01325 [Elusimicrobia bacterium]|nr:hypothetical protein [Elusimicrobiota bacterium]
MSLKNFHLFFILTSLALMGFLGYWSLGQLSRGELAWMMAGSSALGLSLGLFYLRWFMRRHKELL